MVPDQATGSSWTGPDQVGKADRADGPDRTGDHADQQYSDSGVPEPGSRAHPSSINAAAVTAYRDSLEAGAPLSERKLAEMFGLNSRRWARNRMAEARQGLVTTRVR